MGTIAIELRDTTVTAETFIQAATEGKIHFYRVRENGTYRHIPFLTGEDREHAQWIASQREAGRTMKEIADELHLSIPTVRRMINGLLLVEEVEEAEVNYLAQWLREAQDDTAAAAKEGDE